MRYAVSVLVCSVLIGGILYVIHIRDQSTAQSTDNLPAASVAGMATETRTPPKGFREYYSERYSFSVFYPEQLEVVHTPEGGRTSTISFQNPATAEGFQIFVTPYTEEQVSEERFRMDVPSGVREEMRTVMIDGATGASFFSVNATLGETAEIWFVHEGYLYEVTTLKPLALWLNEIMQSWKFF